MTRRVSLLLAAGLVLVDQLTKLAIATPDWGWHPVPFVWWTFAAIPFLAVMTRYPRWRLPMAFALGAAVSNPFSTLHGPVANPFVANPDDPIGRLFGLTGEPITSTFAYNFADVCVLTAQATIIVALAGWAVTVMRRQSLLPPVELRYDG